jgi:hypothetical protein
MSKLDGIAEGDRIRLVGGCFEGGRADAVVTHVAGRDIFTIRFEDAADGTEGLLFLPLGQWKIARQGYARSCLLDDVERLGGDSERLVVHALGGVVLPRISDSESGYRQHQLGSMSEDYVYANTIGGAWYASAQVRRSSGVVIQGAFNAPTFQEAITGALSALSPEDVASLACSLTIGAKAAA